MGKKTISNTFTVNTVEDGESAPYYFQEWFAWSNDPSTSNVTTPPTIGGSWETSIPAQGSYAYLWRKSIRYVWNENTRQYSSEAAQYFRMSGTNGTSINTKGTIKVAITASETFPTAGFSSGDLGIKQGDSYMWQFNGSSWSHVSSASSDGDSYTMTNDCTIDLEGDGTSENIKGHLIQWSTEASKWIDLGQFKGESGKTYYTHIAWATNVKYDSSGDVTSVEGFTPDKSPNDTTHLWMGVRVNESSGADPSDATDYTWSYTKGVDGTSPYFADLNNEMDAIQCKHDGGVIADQTVSTVISMWKGSAVEPFAVDNIYRNGTQLTWDGNNNGVWPRESGSTVSLEFTTSASIADIDDFKITIHSTNDTSVTRELHFTVNGVRSNAIYRLVPSHSQIVKKKNGTYEPSVNVTCSVKKNENGSTSTPSSSEYTLEKSVNGGSYEAYSATAPSSITSDLKFRLKVGGVVVDLETIPLVSDGNKGDAGKNAGEVILTPTTIFFNGDEGRYVYDTEYIQVGVGMKVDGQSCVISNISVGNTPVGISYTLSGTTITFHNTSSDYGDIEGSVSIVVTGTITVGSITTTYIATGVLSIVCTQAGEQGETGEQGQRGKIGRFFYFAGTFNSQDNDPTHGFVVNDAQAPYFEHSETVTTQSGTTTVKRYHVFNYDTNGKYTMAQMWAISSNWNNKPWEVMTNDFKYIITEAIFAPLAHLGSFVISGDYFISQYGTIFYNNNGTIETTIIDASNVSTLFGGSVAYAWFADSDPMANTMPTTGNYKFRPMKCINALTGEEWMAEGKVHVDANGDLSMQNIEISGSISYHKAAYASWRGGGGYFGIYDFVYQSGTPVGVKILYDMLIVRHFAEISGQTYTIYLPTAKLCIGVSIRIYNDGPGNGVVVADVGNTFDEVIYGSIPVDAGVDTEPVNRFYDPSVYQFMANMAIEDYAMIEFTAVYGIVYDDASYHNHEYNINWMVTDFIKKQTT